MYFTIKIISLTVLKKFVPRSQSEYTSWRNRYTLGRTDVATQTENNGVHEYTSTAPEKRSIGVQAEPDCCRLDTPPLRKCLCQRRLCFRIRVRIRKCKLYLPYCAQLF